MRVSSPALTGFLSLLLTTGGAVAADDAKPPPNIVIFVADDLGATDIGPYGNKIVRTPHLDRLARQSLRFTHAFAGSPTCVPSRAVLLSGLMPFRNGAHLNHSQCREGIETLPSIFRRAGYQVVQAGKQHYGPKGLFPFETLKDSNIPEPGFEKKPGLRMDLNVAVVGTWLKERDRQRPFLLYVCDHSPHVVWPDRPEYRPDEVDIPPLHINTPDTRVARARYYTDITKMDRNVGRLLDLLEQHGLVENTIFIFTSDQGPQWPFAKWSLYDAGLRVPLLVRWPGRVPAGASTSALLSHVDVLPTLLEAAGVAAPSGLDGKSSLPVLVGKSDRHRDEIFASHSGDGVMNVAPARCIRTTRYKYILNLKPEIKYTTHMDKALDHDGGREYWPSWIEKAKTDPAAAAILKRYHFRPREELYDIVDDPLELRNLIGEPRLEPVLNQLRGRLAQWRKQQGDDIGAEATPDR